MSESAPEKPIHVRVAEVLGCHPVFEPPAEGEAPIWRCLCPVPTVSAEATSIHELPDRPRHVELRCGPSRAVARYDVSWFALGPWIDKLGIDVVGDIELVCTDAPGNAIYVDGHLGNQVYVYGFLAGMASERGFDENTGQPAYVPGGRGKTSLLAVCDLLLKLNKGQPIAGFGPGWSVENA